MSVPSPSLMPQFKAPAAAPVTVTVAEIEPETTAKIVRPGTRKVVVISPHDGVIKAKNLKPGMKVRAWLHGEPKGSERVVETVERIEDGALVRVTFSSAHPENTYKAAYRFHVQELVGTAVETIETVPALVAYEEI